MDIIYMGLMFCEDSLNHEFEKSTKKVAMAPHKFQMNLLKGLESQKDINVSVIHVPPTGSFPINNSQFISNKYKWGENNLQIGYINLPWFKRRIQMHQLYQQVKQRIREEETTYIILYSLYEPFLITAQRIKEEFPDIHICLIHTDAVPGRDDMAKYMTKRAKKRGDRAVKLARICDSFIILTQNLVKPLEIGARPYLVVECICDERQQPANIESSMANTFLYTGGVDKAYGICELAQVFEKLSDFQLWICGDGDARAEIQEICLRCPNIHFFGYVPPEKIKILQDECSFLVNPRRPSGTYTKYSFPSKTAEYMMTGKPVIMYKLEAIPDEYDNYLNYFCGNTYEELFSEIIAYTQMEYKNLISKAQKARNYVLRDKSPEVTGAKIIEFLKQT